MTRKTPEDRYEEYLRKKPLTWSKLIATLLGYSIALFIAVAIPVVALALVTAVVALTWRIVSGL